MSAFSIDNLTFESKRFHDIFVDVYKDTKSLDQISFWKENNRTIFSFEKLESKTNKKISELSLDEITTFIAEYKIHKIPTLAKAIKRNGVQIPLIIRDDGKLLDGNRRFFACQWLRIQSEKAKEPIPKVLLKIPVYIVLKKDLPKEKELKILTEENFIPDLKIPWPLDAQARAVREYVSSVIKEKEMSHEEALNEVVSTFSITKGRAQDLLNALKLSEEFIGKALNSEETLKRQEIVESKFVYFWEFLNKATKGKSGYTKPEELSDVKEMFFQLMGKGRDSPIRNVKQVEPLAQAKREPRAWAMLKESKGAQLSIVVDIINEKKERRKAVDKIRVFSEWLESENNLNDAAKKKLLVLAQLAEKKGSEEA